MSATASLTDKQHALASAFELFNQLSEELTGSYRQLQLQVLELSEELAAARSERMIQLAEKERLADRLERLLETLPAAVVVLDGEGRIREFNPAAERLLGRLGLGCRWSDYLNENAYSVEPRSNELKLKNGRLLTLTSSTLEQAPGRIIVMLDMTETRRLQERLNRRERLTAMGEMSAKLAHQLRTPLSTALLYTSHLAADQLDPARRRQFAAKLRDRLQHMERQIHDILSFARGGEAGSDPICLSECLGAFVAASEQLLESAGVSLTLEDRSRGQACMNGRQDVLQGLFGNLLENAMQHGADTIAVTLRVARDIEIDFADNGSGIPEALRHQIFDPFFTTRSGGTGLGLAVVQNLVLNHGGEIHAGRSAAGGALFHMRFPLAVEPAQALLPAGAVGQSKQQASIVERRSLS